MGMFNFYKKGIKIFAFILCVSLFFVNTDNIRAQGVKVFTSDKLKFPEDVKDYFEAADKKPGREFGDAFILFWNSGKLTEEEKDEIITTCNLYVKKRIKTFPDLKNYLESFRLFKESSQPPSSFVAWKKSLDFFLNGKVFRKFPDFMETAYNLLNQGIIYTSSYNTWKTNNKDFVFAFDTVPKVVFSECNITCTIRGDSSVIYNTKGVYYPSTELFIGKGGKINWQRAEFDEGLMYADFKTTYRINIKNSHYNIDSVNYYNTKYFKKPLLGKITEKCITGAKGENANYPQFDSYDLRIKIPHISDGLDYDGGFSMHGVKFIGSGTKEQNAQLRFNRKDKLFLLVSSDRFIIRPDQITSNRSSVLFFNDKDSIYHPGLVFKFYINRREVTLIRDEQGMALSPYFNSYHKLDMYFEALYWKLDENFIDMKRLLGSSAYTANFESNNYFRESRYDKIKGLSEINPLVQIRNYSKSINSKTFDVLSLAKYQRLSVDAIRPTLMKLATQGFLDFDVENDIITIKDRTNHYINSKAKIIDYDIIEFNSEIKDQPNATLNLLNWDLKLRGVPEIALSDSQSVFINPKGEELTVKKDRDFTFAGKINAGRFQFFGKEFSFEYKTFKLNLVNTDSLRILVQSKETDEMGKPKLVRCKTVIEQINGELLIDKPNNKSGNQSLQQYPIFISAKPSFAYYDRKTIFNGVYNRSAFYFKLDPFTIDSLDNFTNEALNFAGDFSSTDIFPVFRENLRLQDDYSLGFIRPTPEEGFPIYKGKAQYFKDINLSNRGLRGDGFMKYLASTTTSKDFYFFPDSMNFIAQKFELAETDGKVQYPDAKGEDVKMHFRPYKDYLKVKTIEKPIKMYHNKADFYGETTLSPEIYEGNGKTVFQGADLISKKIKFSKITMDADTADFMLTDVESAELSFTTTNVKAHIDFDKKFGDFKANGAGSLVKFPQNQYICYMDRFKWFMETKNIELSADGKKGEVADTTADVAIDGAEFISIHPDQDSLRFKSPAATYDIRNKVVYCREVKYVDVADARTYPDSGLVTIRKKAKLDEFKNSSIVANSVTKYHKLYKANINVYGRKSYSGTAYYDYIDENKQIFPFFFANVGVDTTGQTTASASIADTAEFELSPHFDFRGSVKLFASRKNLVFDGGVKIAHACNSIARSWYEFESEINPNEIYIPVDFTVTEGAGDKNDKLSSGIVITNDSTHIYSAFLSKKKNYSDTDILTANGYLFYDKPSKEYRISNLEKLKELALPGNYISLNTSNCIVYGEGKVNLGADLGRINASSYGNGTNNLNNGDSRFDLVTTVDFFFADDCIRGIAKAFEEANISEAVNYSRPVYEKSLREMLSKETADKLISQLNLYGSFKRFPSELEHTFMFADLKMMWNTATKSYTSDGKIGLASVNRTQINKMVNGRIEFQKKKSGDILNIYLELDANNWYYFNYQAGLMQGISSDPKFNETIKALKADKRKLDSEKGQKPYSFILSTERKKKDFLKKFEIGGAPPEEDK
jgi:hypothetical protein